MTVKKAAALAVAILLVGLAAIVYIFRDSDSVRIDPVAVNDIAQSLAEQWDSLKSGGSLPGLSYHLDYVVLDAGGRLVGATRSGLNENLNDSIANRDTIVDVACGGKYYGKLIIYNQTAKKWKQFRNSLMAVCVGLVLSLILFIILYSLFIDHFIFQPFRRLREFAGRVAEGNFDIPLKMDRGNLFGAFTESFDLMRDELAKARESERQANESKKELVASLSHDIKTPVASIKAVSEIMMVKSHNSDEKKRLGIINAKADQINALITNLFNATLEELQRLSVKVSQQPSTVLSGMIRNADYNGNAAVSAIPDCRILADSQRLQQVIDNVVNNSYKYAGTSISVSAVLQKQYLKVEFRDFGRGVSPEELPLLLHKYYRAKNAEGKNGGGLGLYISKYLMNRMSGDIACRNTEDGFAVTLKLLVVQDEI
jgi:signal transduction histidine kinase